jgi:hypothetical protein
MSSGPTSFAPRSSSSGPTAIKKVTPSGSAISLGSTHRAIDRRFAARCQRQGRRRSPRDTAERPGLRPGPTLRERGRHRAPVQAFVLQYRRRWPRLPGLMAKNHAHRDLPLAGLREPGPVGRDRFVDVKKTAVNQSVGARGDQSLRRRHRVGDRLARHSSVFASSAQPPTDRQPCGHRHTRTPRRRVRPLPSRARKSRAPAQVPARLSRLSVRAGGLGVTATG